MLSRRTSALHAHRWSQPAMAYFVTCCTQFRATGLNVPPVEGVLHKVVVASDAGRDTVTAAFTIMPDHIHWLFTLGDRLSLGRVIARLKSQSGHAMAAARLEWQRDFFDHRLRADETIERYGLYVFLNPYRAGLITADEKWPHWWCPHPENLSFISELNPAGTPPPEWIGEPAQADLETGE